MSDRDAFREARAIGKAKLHEKRLENATYTAAEVKVLTEAALRLGRKEAGEEIAAAIQAEQAFSVSKLRANAAQAALRIGSQPSGAASDAISGVPRHSEVSEGPQVLHKPFPDDGVTYCGWHVGDGVVHEGCGEVWPCSTVRGAQPLSEQDAVHEDLRQILLTLGLGDQARPYSSHEVVQREVLPAIKRLISEVSEAPKAPQKPPKLVCRRCNGLLGVTAGVNPVPCPDCAKGDT